VSHGLLLRKIQDGDIGSGMGNNPGNPIATATEVHHEKLDSGSARVLESDIVAGNDIRGVRKQFYIEG